MDGILGGIGDFFSNIFGGADCDGCGDNDASGAKGGLFARAGGAKDAIASSRGGGNSVGESILDEDWA